MKSLTIFLLLCASCFADVKAVIDGPTEAKVGDLVVLSASESVGDNMQWVPPTPLQILMCGDGSQLAFATGTAGTYEFLLIVANKEAAIQYTKHTVKVTGQLTPAPPVTPPPPEKPDLPPPAMQELVDLSRSTSKQLQDPTTASGLAETIRATATALEKQCSTGQCPGLAECKKIMIAAVENRLGQRTGISRTKDWLTVWRTPINQKLAEVNSADVPTYLTAMRAVALGLSD